MLEAEPLYRPNETELQLNVLKTRLTTLQTQNAAVDTAYAAYSNALIVRNETLYGEGEGLVGIAGDVKRYVRSLFGATSPQFKQLSGITFTALK